MKNIFKPKLEEKDELKELTKILYEVKKDIDEAYKMFEMTNDDFLVDAYIYQINSLNARYNYILNEIKNKENEKYIITEGRV